MATLLHQQDDLIERLELDLVDKVKAAYTSLPEVQENIFGVFSIDDLETKLESDFGTQIGVGVGYLGAELPGPSSNPADRSRAGKTLQFKFIILLAVPVDQACVERYNATKLLTLLRKNILGNAITGDAVNRTWDFVAEKPEITASTATMLYYSQVWQVAMQNFGI